ncbi:checkpoint protein hus1 isoform X3 [Amborella trichopoda]|uniref:checkpoint protein hus1 isoform X3 n=1 Tax=Amborella trichopoda TaxID=13333 RepID=UPI0009BCB8D6|nr:checkpoint protein hus1 isoform X3 [Amborella trichopoda]|eukprot:XP_020526300.1 checkpoint protein hus1 isoform X3 [Amborella trichopoda]
MEGTLFNYKMLLNLILHIISIKYIMNCVTCSFQLSRYQTGESTSTTVYQIGFPAFTLLIFTYIPEFISPASQNSGKSTARVILRGRLQWKWKHPGCEIRHLLNYNANTEYEEGRMKFKAFLRPHGVNLLERRFIPAFDKIGRVCHLYLTRDHAILLHNLLNGDGIQAIAQFKKEVLFEDYRISSQNDDRIALAVDLGLLHRALRSSVSMDGDRLQIKLVKKRAVASEHPMPFLTFESKGYRSAVIQDVPVSKPLSRVDVHHLQTALDMAQGLPQTLVQVPDLFQLQSLVERLKHVGELLNVSITQYGDLHLQVSSTLVTLGTEYRKLRVLGVQVDAPAVDDSISASARIELALQRGEASSVVLLRRVLA